MKWWGKKIQRWNLVFGALKWAFFGLSTTIFDKITAYWKWQLEKIASLLEDSEGKSVVYWSQYHGYMQIK